MHCLCALRMVGSRKVVRGVRWHLVGALSLLLAFPGAGRADESGVACDGETIPPDITCPGDTTVECGNSTDPSATGNATATDNCTVSPFISFSDFENNTCGNALTITRTWTATDDLGNQATCDQSITVEDTTEPLISCPGDTTVECGDSTDPSATGNASATDVCDSDPTITYSDETASSCGATEVITRTWQAEDDCGNVATCDQIITVEDTTEPLISCPGDTTVECGGDTSTNAQGVATATDDCGDVTITFDDAAVPGACGLTETITRTWTAEDECGNTATCDQTITVEDTTDPEITCPGDVTVECGDTSTNAAGVATATDDCGDVTITFSDDSVPGACGLTETITRTWTAEDVCGNTATCDQVITVEDTTDPEITCPGDTTVECGGDTGTNATGVATATDACGDVTVTFSDVSVPGVCGVTITRTWTAEDACGNAAACDQVITVADTTPPLLTVPSDTAVYCGESTATNITGLATAVDDCGTPPPPPVPSIWINEFHTDNSGTDTGEFVEVAGTAGFDLSGVQLVLYNGSGGAVYSNRTLSGVISNEGCGFGARSFSYPVNGIQNGSPDGLALAIGTQLVEFISYEGTFVGVGGPAAGVLSVDIGVTELGTDPPGLSLQKLGAGNSEILSNVVDGNLTSTSS